MSQVVKKFDININILSGDINQLVRTSVGYLILELTGERDEIKRAIEYLKNENVNVEVM